MHTRRSQPPPARRQPPPASRLFALQRYCSPVTRTEGVSVQFILPELSYSPSHKHSPLFPSFIATLSDNPSKNRPETTRERASDRTNKPSLPRIPDNHSKARTPPLPDNSLPKRRHSSGIVREIAIALRCIPRPSRLLGHRAAGAYLNHKNISASTRQSVDHLYHAECTLRSRHPAADTLSWIPSCLDDPDCNRNHITL